MCGAQCVARVWRLTLPSCVCLTRRILAFGSVPSPLLNSVPVHDPWAPDMPTRTLPTLAQQRRWTRQQYRAPVQPADRSDEIGWEDWIPLRR